MSEDPDTDAALAEIQAVTAQVRAALAQIRGTGTAAGGAITATVDSAGHLRALTLPRDPARWGSRLSELIVEAATAAETDARKQTTHAIRPLTENPRIASGLDNISQALNTAPPGHTSRPMTPEEMQAADDEYFQRHNQHGWIVPP